MIYRFFLILTSFLPVFVAAQGIQGVITEFRNVLNLAFPVVIGLAFLFFLWGLANFILNSGNEEKRTEGKRLMTWGVIALFIMVSVWGIVWLLRFEFGLSTYIIGP
jgi:hypothetical protein